MEFNDGTYHVNNINFTGNGKMRFGLWDRCNLGTDGDGCNLTANTVTTNNNGQGVLSVYGNNNVIDSIGAVDKALEETHVHGTLTLNSDSSLGKVMYGGTLNVGSNVNLGFSTGITSYNDVLEVTYINASGQDLNLANGFNVGAISSSNTGRLLNEWSIAKAAGYQAVMLNSAAHSRGVYISYGTLKIKGDAADYDFANNPALNTCSFDVGNNNCDATSGVHTLLLSADGKLVSSTVGSMNFVLAALNDGNSEAYLVFTRDSLPAVADGSNLINMGVYGGMINALEALISSGSFNKASTVLQYTIGGLEILPVSQRMDAIKQMADMSVNNSVTTSIKSVGMQVGQAIAAHNANAVDVGLGINSGDETLGPRNNVWLQAIGSWNDQNRRDGVDGYRADTYGTALGFDRMVQDGTSLGIALHYANTRVDGKGVFSGNNTKINSYGITLYGQQSLTSQLVLDGRLGYAYHDIRANRSSSILNERASGSWGGNQIDAAAKLGYTVALPQNVAVTPSLGLAYTYLHEGSYTEKGDGMALKVGSRSTNALLIGGGVKGSKVWTTEDKTTITPELHGGVYYDALASSIDTTAQFVGGGSSFVTRNVKPDPWVFNVGAGIKVATTDNLAFSVNYDAALRDQFVGHTASLKAKMTF